jgi:hypothetical protein
METALKQVLLSIWEMEGCVVAASAKYLGEKRRADITALLGQSADRGADLQPGYDHEFLRKEVKSSNLSRSTSQPFEDPPPLFRIPQILL